MPVFDLQEYNKEKLDSIISADAVYIKATTSLIFDSNGSTSLTLSPSLKVVKFIQ